MASRPPLIGVIGYHIQPDEGVGGVLRGVKGQSFNLFSLDYIECVRRSGGIPVALPLVRDEAVIRHYCDLIQGLVITGGEDVDPWLYGQEPDPNLGRIDTDRDRFDLALADLALERGLPTLAICRGMQLVNVLRAGTLVQELRTDAPPGRLPHWGLADAPRWYPLHQVNLQPGSLLEELYESELICTNSYHHQAVDRLGAGLEAAAWQWPGSVPLVGRSGPVADATGIVLARQALLNILSLAPLNKVMYGSDGFILPEVYWSGALGGREELGWVLDDLVRRDSLGRGEALAVAADILHGTARRLYRL